MAATDKFQAGMLYHRVKVQEDQGTTKNAMGEPIEDWVTIKTRYAKIEPLTGREYWDAQQIKSNVTHTVTMRFCEGLTTKMRLVFQGRIFNLGNILCPGEVREWHVCKCIEKV